MSSVQIGLVGGFFQHILEEEGQRAVQRQTESYARDHMYGVRVEGEGGKRRGGAGTARAIRKVDPLRREMRAAMRARIVSVVSMEGTSCSRTVRTVLYTVLTQLKLHIR